MKTVEFDASFLSFSSILYKPLYVFTRLTLTICKLKRLTSAWNPINSLVFMRSVLSSLKLDIYHGGKIIRETGGIKCHNRVLKKLLKPAICILVLVFSEIDQRVV